MEEVTETESESPKEEPKNNFLNYVVIIIIFILLIAGAYLFLESGGKDEGAQSTTQPQEEGVADENVGNLEDNEATQSANMDFSKYKDTKELIVETTKEGVGDEIKEGQTAVVNYTGYLTNGTMFDTSKNLGSPFGFTLGGGEVIDGWEKGVLGMKVGEIRRLVIPPDLGYGDRDLGDIPPNSILIFDVELTKIE